MKDYSIPYVIEVKNEDKYADSKNLCIELYQGKPRKPSGLAICESQICIHTFLRNVAIYRVQFMRLFIARNKKSLIIKDFANADNFNGGLIHPKRGFIKFPWFEYCEIGDMPESEIFIYQF